ncbi:GntR family transcriptional regulator [Amycolatopsis alkalitolerans]|uniref:GntR family transcriptional regulator n=1 Tax=Amycolatopsis alkalitolerans TaxID=2547244 RepID=A0A5C4LXW6_9PSEU|nr:GntR family transcriptional regulator [Amycolatopsis alkalitolerans]TNC23720.1 GntR family transcriptional regulator [Amycolatopsis alkalitolerans]
MTVTKPKYLLCKTGELLVWAQLADHLTARIDQGEFKNSLPPNAVLAAEYGVAENTVSRAIDDLISRGVIKPLEGRAFHYVREADGMWLHRDQWRNLASKINDDDAMSVLSEDAPVAWAHGFRADVRREEFRESEA